MYLCSLTSKLLGLVISRIITLKLSLKSVLSLKPEYRLSYCKQYNHKIVIDTRGYTNVLRILHHYLIICHTQIIGIGPWGLVLAQIITFAHWAAE